MKKVKKIVSLVLLTFTCLLLAVVNVTAATMSVNVGDEFKVTAKDFYTSEGVESSYTTGMVSLSNSSPSVAFSASGKYFYYSYGTHADNRHMNIVDPNGYYATYAWTSEMKSGGSDRKITANVSKLGLNVDQIAEVTVYYYGGGSVQFNDNFIDHTSGDDYEIIKESLYTKTDVVFNCLSELNVFLEMDIKIVDASKKFELSLPKVTAIANETGTETLTENKQVGNSIYTINAGCSFKNDVAFSTSELGRSTHYINTNEAVKVSNNFSNSICIDAPTSGKLTVAVKNVTSSPRVAKLFDAAGNEVVQENTIEVAGSDTTTIEFSINEAGKYYFGESKLRVYYMNFESDVKDYVLVTAQYDNDDTPNAIRFIVELGTADLSNISRIDLTIKMFNVDDEMYLEATKSYTTVYSSIKDYIEKKDNTYYVVVELTNLQTAKTNGYNGFFATAEVYDNFNSKICRKSLTYAKAL